MKNTAHAILITGASSGIGKALALHYAERGIRLFLQGRNAERLEEVAQSCRARGAVVETALRDVRDKAGMAEWIGSADRKVPLDLVIANAGMGMGQPRPETLDRLVTDTFEVNLEGVFNTVHPAFQSMASRGHGQIAIMSSMAGFFGMPGAFSYSAAKGAARLYGEGLRGYAAKYGVKVGVICPGFVKSPLTDRNRFPMPFLMEADKAAAIIARGLARNKARIAFPLGLYLPVLAFSWLPIAIREKIMRRVPGKE